jgi:hypothetical protein
MKAIIYFFLFMSFSIPNPVENAPILKIARSIDRNEVHYFVNVDKNGNLIESEPLKLLWKNHNKGGVYEDLNWIKKKYGYGVKVLYKTKEKINFRFVAYQKKQFHLQKNSNGSYAIFADFDNKQVELTSFFVNIEGGSFWVPNVVSVDIKGIEIGSLDFFTKVLKP